jgi:Spy/CpxP family protein refolding chaperone
MRDSADRRAERRQRPRLDQFARNLDLTPAQKAAVDSVMAHEFATVNAIREEMWPRIRAVVDDTRQKIDSLLTPSQRDRYHALLARLEQDRRVRRGPGPH